MHPKHHILLGAITTFLIFLISGINSLEASIIFLASFLIDIDHYLIYIISSKNISLKKARNYFFNWRKKWLEMPIKKREDYKRPILFLHGIEFVLLLIILGIFNNLFLFILIGITMHLFFDYMDILIVQEPLYCKFSQVYVHMTNKRKKSVSLV